MNKVENLFADKAVIIDKIMLFPKETALLFIKACENREIKILGIDAFYLSKDNIEPSLANSVDFSSSQHLQKEESIYLEAINFLKEKSGNLFFEIVCG